MLFFPKRDVPGCGSRNQSNKTARFFHIQIKKMELNTAIEVINGSDRSSDEKKHLRKLVSNGGLLPARFAGTPNFDEILDDFPVLG
jgi:hypothetical protein